MNETTGLRPYERVTQPWTIPEREKRKVIEVEDEVGGQAKKLRRDDIRFFISSIPAGQKMNQSRDETRAVQGEQTGLEMGLTRVCTWEMLPTGWKMSANCAWEMLPTGWAWGREILTVVMARGWGMQTVGWA